jgi:hypothetical protein
VAGETRNFSDLARKRVLRSEGRIVKNFIDQKKRDMIIYPKLLRQPSCPDSFYQVPRPR